MTYDGDIPSLSLFLDTLYLLRLELILRGVHYRICSTYSRQEKIYLTKNFWKTTTSDLIFFFVVGINRGDRSLLTSRLPPTLAYKQSPIIVMGITFQRQQSRHWILQFLWLCCISLCLFYSVLFSFIQFLCSISYNIAYHILWETAAQPQQESPVP